ncbi:hypothetical protein BDB01DRAFT_465732 [Pilobolus umbonatus]|nr:hypothetical protein BDB01DRAFT_465732 [Pilobolus umbonatus]
MKSEDWKEILNDGGNKDYFYYGLNSVYSPLLNSTFYLGGFKIPRSRNLGDSYIPYSELTQLSIGNFIFTTHNLTENIPTIRNNPTTTLLLLYGKNLNFTGAIKDVCHLLDLESKKWRNCNIDSPVGINLLREDHSAVLVRDRLFILFGQWNGTLLQEILVFDVSDANHIRYLSEYSYYQETNKLGKGTIAGISVGCIVFPLSVFSFLLGRRELLRKQNLLMIFLLIGNK